MFKGNKEQKKVLEHTHANWKEFVGKRVCITDSKETEWHGEILKVRTQENEEDSVIVKLLFGHIVFWESDIRNIVMYEQQEKEAI